jgi:hypothetical protein
MGAVGIYPKTPEPRKNGRPITRLLKKNGARLVYFPSNEIYFPSNEIYFPTSQNWWYNIINKREEYN